MAHLDDRCPRTVETVATTASAFRWSTSQSKPTSSHRRSFCTRFVARRGTQSISCLIQHLASGVVNKRQHRMGEDTTQPIKAIHIAVLDSLFESQARATCRNISRVVIGPRPLQHFECPPPTVVERQVSVFHGHTFSRAYFSDTSKPFPNTCPVQTAHAHT